MVRVSVFCHKIDLIPVIFFEDLKSQRTSKLYDGFQSYSDFNDALLSEIPLSGGLETSSHRVY